MSREWRPRIRASRKEQITREKNFIAVVCRDEADAIGVESFLRSMFAAAIVEEKAQSGIASEVAKLAYQHEAKLQKEQTEALGEVDEAEFKEAK